MTDSPFQLTTGQESGQINSISLYGQQLLGAAASTCELWVNGLPLALRPHTDPHHPAKPHLKGERWTDHFSGWSLVLSRQMGERSGLKHPAYGVQYGVRRELCDQSLPAPGPGGPPVEAPLWVDTLGIFNLPWQFWGDDTRLLFPSSHSNGPIDEWGHCGYENDRARNRQIVLKKRLAPHLSGRFGRSRRLVLQRPQRQLARPDLPPSRCRLYSQHRKRRARHRLRFHASQRFRNRRESAFARNQNLLRPRR